MRIGEPQKYTVEGVAFWASSIAEPRLAQQEFIREALVGASEWTPEEDAAVGRKLEEATYQFLAETVVRIENLQDAEGIDITAWRDDLPRLVPPPLLKELAARIFDYRIDEAGDEGNAPSGSESSPSTTTEDEH